MPNKVNVHFKGAAYRFDHLVMENIDEYVYSISKEQAISCFKSRVKEKLGLIKATDIRLSGMLYIKYDDRHREKYRLTKNTLHPEEVMRIPFPSEGEGKVRLDTLHAKEYGKSVVSVEEAKWLLIQDEVRPNRRIMFVSDEGEREDVTHEVTSIQSGKVIVLGDNEYLYDPDEDVYWMDGARYSNRIEIREDYK